ncbi:MAG: N-acetyl-gamma-glutamyl-phosphate reductase [Myxococcaceae bacterium]
MQPLRAGVVGASGYSGLELTRILLRHERVTLAFATSDRWEGQAIAAKTGLASDLSYVSVEQGVAAAKGCQVVFLATPAESSLKLGPRLAALGVTVVDLAGTFRLKDASLYPPFYRFEHSAPDLLAKAVYGLPELFREQVKGARFVANPGCYPTAAALSVAPLLKAGLVEPQSLVINAASGVSGAGRKATEDFGFMEVDSDFRAYRTLKHQHLPEIRQTLTRVAGADVPLVFTPHLLPVKRGILSTATAKVKRGVTTTQVQQALADAYGKEPFIGLKSEPDAVRLADVVLTPRCLLGAATDGSHVVAIAAIDNLLKGAASQAVQNMNLALGLPEPLGLL